MLGKRSRDNLLEQQVQDLGGSLDLLSEFYEDIRLKRLKPYYTQGFSAISQLMVNAEG